MILVRPAPHNRPDFSMPTSDDLFQEAPAQSLDEKGLRFRSIRVQRFHGLNHGVEVDLCDDVNVVFGSNASGKTTLARAIRAMLWPDQIEDQQTEVEGTFSLNGASWRVALEGRNCDYLKNQRPESPPALPPSSHGRRYHLYLHDLLRRAEGDQGFAELILREAQGGIDVEGAAQALGFEVPTRRKSKTARAVEELRADVHAARSEQESLREDEKRLDALREKRAAAQEASTRVTALEQALEVARARAEHEEAAAALDAFPPVLEEVRGDEHERLASLQDQVQSAERQAEEAKQQLHEAQAILEESRIPDSGLPEGRLEEIRTVTTTLQEQERNVRERREDLEGVKEEEQAAWNRLDAGVDREEAAELHVPAVQKIESHVQAVEAVQGEKQALATAEELFANTAPDRSVEALREGLRQLHHWLQVPSSASSEGRKWRVVLLGSGVLVAGLGILLLVIGAGVAAWLGPLLLLLGVLVVVADLLGSGTATASNRRSLHAQEFERMDLESPDAWDREAVERLADRLLDHLQEAAVRTEKQETWDRLRPKREEIEEKAEELREERTRLAREVGLDPDVSSRTLAWLVDRLSRWQSAYDEWKGTQAALLEAEEEAASCRDRLEELLAPYDLGPVDDASDALGAVETLQSAWNEFRDAQRTLRRAEEKKDSAETTLEAATEDRATLYQQLGVEEGDEDALRSLIEQHKEYEEVVDTEQTAHTTLQAEKRHLRRCEGFEEWMGEVPEETLRQERETAQTTADREEEYLDEIKDIEHAIEAAQDGGTLEQLQAEYREKRTELAQDREQDYDRAVGAVVADLVQEETRDRGLPPVFHRARTLFAEITNDRYELQLDREQASFRAYDHFYDEPFSLDALSSGTKVQLLLSVRVAFVETQEQGCRVPLVLDEALANSDAQRARALIDAVRTLCHHGRQVFYLTAQADEVQKWRERLRGDEAIEHEVIALSDLDEREVAPPPNEASVPTRATPPDLPDAGETSHQALKDLLGVPHWSPRQPVKRLHLWYLIDSPPLLLDVIETGTRTWGQLQFQHQRGGPTASQLSEEERSHIRALVRAVESWKEAWQVGRGRPVDRAALEQTDAVTETFIDGVSDLAAELDGDAEALLQVIRARSDERVSGFRSAKADDLETYLRENGFLDPQDRLSQEEMWQYVLADLASERRDDRVSLDDLDRLFERLQGTTPSRSET